MLLYKKGCRINIRCEKRGKRKVEKQRVDKMKSKELMTQGNKKTGGMIEEGTDREEDENKGKRKKLARGAERYYHSLAHYA